MASKPGKILASAEEHVLLEPFCQDFTGYEEPHICEILECARSYLPSGDHRVFKNPEGRITVVSGKPGDDVRPGTYRAVLRQTGIKETDQ